MLQIGFIFFLQLLPLGPASGAAPCCSARGFSHAGGNPTPPKSATTVHPFFITEAAVAPQPAASVVVHGTIRAQGQPLPSEMVVFLEPADPTLHLPLSSKCVQISQKAAEFSPAFTVVSVGQSVQFLNDEDRQVEHNVFSNAPAARFDLGLFPPGQSRTVVFDKPGPVVLYCSIHKFMDGVIYVCPTPLFSRVDGQGRFRIEGVRPGGYTLRTWQRRKRFLEQSMPLKVESAGDLTVDLEMRRK
jgi:plastocyanin